MAKKEPTKPDEIKNDPATETPTEETRQPEQPLEVGGEHTPPEVAAGEPAAPAQEAETALSDKGEEHPAPFDIGGEHRPGDDVVVSFDKINEIISEKKAAAKTQEAKQPRLRKSRRNRGRPRDPAPDGKRTRWIYGYALYRPQSHRRTGHHADGGGQHHPTRGYFAQ